MSSIGAFWGGGKQVEGARLWPERSGINYQFTRFKPSYHRHLLRGTYEHVRTTLQDTKEILQSDKVALVMMDPFGTV